MLLNLSCASTISGVDDTVLKKRLTLQEYIFRSVEMILEPGDVLIEASLFRSPSSSKPESIDTLAICFSRSGLRSSSVTAHAPRCPEIS